MIRIKRTDGELIAILRPWQRRFIVITLLLFCTSPFWWYPALTAVALGLDALGVGLSPAAEDLLLKGFITLLVTLPLGSLVWLIWPPRANRAVIRWRISQGRCGACEYSLDGLLPGNDNVVQCPECGAHWNLGRR